MDFIAENMQKRRAASEYNLSRTDSLFALGWEMPFEEGKFCRINFITRKFFPVTFGDN